MENMNIEYTVFLNSEKKLNNIVGKKEVCNETTEFELIN